MINSNRELETKQNSTLMNELETHKFEEDKPEEQDSQRQFKLNQTLDDPEQNKSQYLTTREAEKSHDMMNETHEIGLEEGLEDDYDEN